MPNPSLVRVLAASLLAGPQTIEGTVDRVSTTLGRPYPWLRALASRYLHRFADTTRPRQRDVVHFLLRDSRFLRAYWNARRPLSIAHWLTEPEAMQPVSKADGWDLPPLMTTSDLADWLWIDDAELEWFADLRGLANAHPGNKLTHYYYRVLAKQSGGLRLIEAPKNRLKKLQQQILGGILDKIPLHPAAHGFCHNRSILTFASPHAGKAVLLRMDLENFFPTFSGARVQAFFRTLGYPERVADRLGNICTNVVPAAVWDSLPFASSAEQLRDAKRLHARPHLPQGAPSSPALANLCAFRIDCRLLGLAEAAGAAYTRYADDLAFSGGEDFAKCVERFASHAGAILLEEGFAVNFRKTRVMRRGVRQHLAGLVVNQHLNVTRADFDSLKATLVNCVRFGPESQNREAHPSFRLYLEGRIAFVYMVNPGRARRLRHLFEQIEWSLLST